MAAKETSRLKTPTDLKSNATKAVADALNAILADTFALYMKTKTSTGTSAARISATII